MSSFLKRQAQLQQHLLSCSSTTQAVRSGMSAGLQQEHNDAIYATSSFAFASASEAAGHFTDHGKGNIYSRFTNPTVTTFQTRLAQLEGAERCVAFASGMAALLAIFLSHLQQGDHIVCSNRIFGSIMSMLDNVLVRSGIEVSYVKPTDNNAWQKAMQANTRMLFTETPSNPQGDIVDINHLASIAKQHTALLVVDNCVCTPILQNPIALGADIVMHSATKYIDGQGCCVGGAALGSEEHMEPVFNFLRTTGACMSPFNAWRFINGLETLPLRMQAHSQAAIQVAKWLIKHPKIDTVYYPGLESHPGHALACKQQSAFGGLLSFTIQGDQAAAWRMIDNTRLISITGNFGDAKTTITHPATTTHGRISEVAKKEAGITPNLIRVSVGLENVQDIMDDLAHGLDTV